MYCLGYFFKMCSCLDFLALVLSQNEYTFVVLESDKLNTKNFVAQVNVRLSAFYKAFFFQKTNDGTSRRRSKCLKGFQKETNKPRLSNQIRTIARITLLATVAVF